MEDKPNHPRLPTVMRTEEDFEQCAVRLKALADPDRLKILTCLLGGPKSVSQVAAELNEDLVKISHHLGVMRHANLVRTRKQGKFVIYQLDPQIAAASQQSSTDATIDLGCCRLDLAKPKRRS